MKVQRNILVSLVFTGLVALVYGGGQTGQSAAPLLTELRIAQVMDEGNPMAGQKNEEFARALEAAIGLPVRESVIMDYGVGIEAMRGGRLDVLLVSPMSYYQAKQRTNIEPLVTIEGMGGVTYKSVFITQPNRDDINTLADLRNKRFAFVDPGSSSGYVYPKVTLVKELELDPQQIEDPRYFFETATYSGRHDASIMGVVMGDYDASVVALAIIPMMVNAGVITEESLKIIGETPEIPSPLYIIRADISEEMKTKIRNFYLDYDNAEYFEAVHGNPEIRYTPTAEENYQVIYDLVELLGIAGE